MIPVQPLTRGSRIFYEVKLSFKTVEEETIMSN